MMACCRRRRTRPMPTPSLIRCGNTQPDLCRWRLTYFTSTSANHCMLSSHWSAAAVWS